MRQLRGYGVTRRRIYEFVQDFIAERGYSPTYEEIAQGVSLAARSTVFGHLCKLREAGLVDWVDGSSRSLHLTRRAA